MGSIELLIGNEVSRATNASKATLPEVEDEVFVFPTTPGQQHCWHQEIEDPSNPASNITVRYRLTGRLQASVLELTLQQIVNRHEALRTTFRLLDGDLVQVVTPYVRLDLRHEDLCALSAQQRIETAELYSRREASICFDLRRGPLLRALLLNVGDDDHILVVTTHRVVCDGHSIEVLTRELGAIYEALSQGLDSPLPAPRLQFGDFTVWQAQRLGGKVLEGQRYYWADRLANLPMVELSTDRPRPLVRTHNSAIISLPLPKEVNEEWELLCRRGGLTFFAGLLAAFKILMQRCTRGDDICVRSVLAGRSEVDLEHSIGPFSNPVILRTNLAGDPSFDELVMRVRDTVAGAVANQDIPFEMVEDTVLAKSDARLTDFVPIHFSYIRRPGEVIDAAGLSITTMPSVSCGAWFDLSVFLIHSLQSCVVSCEFNSDLFDEATISILLKQYQTLLAEILKNSKCRVSEYALGCPLANPFIGAAPDLPSSVPGRERIQRRLVDIWKGFLEIEQIYIADDFFDLGGHSLLASQMLAQIEEEFDQKIPFTIFLQRPTIAALAALLSRVEIVADCGVSVSVGSAPLHPERPTLFLVHDGDGDSVLYLNLARCLRDEIEVYCLEPLGSKSSPCLHTRIPDMARYYIEQMQLTLPRGPYFLGGLCAGGVIAFEMATQLRAKGEEIGFVALFDAVAPRAKQRAGIIAEQRRVRFLQTLRDTTGLTLWQRWQRRMQVMGQKVCNLFVYEVSKRANRLLSWVRFLAFQLALDRGRPVPTWAEGLPVRVIYDMAEQNYVPGGKYDVPIVLMRATAGEGDDEPLVNFYDDEMLGWAAYVSEKVNYIDVPGGHSSMLKEPHVAVLATHLRAGIQRRLEA